MADPALQNFFAKKDKKKVTKYKTEDIMKNKNNKAKKQAEQQRQQQQQPFEYNFRILQSDDSEWNDYEEEKAKDYSNLKIQNLKLEDKETTYEKAKQAAELEAQQKVEVKGWALPTKNKKSKKQAASSSAEPSTSSDPSITSEVKGEEPEENHQNGSVAGDSVAASEAGEAAENVNDETSSVLSEGKSDKQPAEDKPKEAEQSVSSEPKAYVPPHLRNKPAGSSARPSSNGHSDTYVAPSARRSASGASADGAYVPPFMRNKQSSSGGGWGNSPYGSNEPLAPIRLGSQRERSVEIKSKVEFPKLKKSK